MFGSQKRIEQRIAVEGKTPHAAGAGLDVSKSMYNISGKQNERVCGGGLRAGVRGTVGGALPRLVQYARVCVPAASNTTA